MKHTRVQNCKLIDIEQKGDRRGLISVVENNHQIPFEVKRIYYLYDIPSGAERGGHAHKNLYQLVVAVSGSFDVVVNDGDSERIINLNRPSRALYFPPGLWRELKNFSSGAICLVLASEKYSEKDYIRDFNEFKTYKGDS